MCVLSDMMPCICVFAIATIIVACIVVVSFTLYSIHTVHSTQYTCVYVYILRLPFHPMPNIFLLVCLLSLFYLMVWLVGRCSVPPPPSSHNLMLVIVNARECVRAPSIFISISLPLLACWIARLLAFHKLELHASVIIFYNCGQHKRKSMDSNRAEIFFYPQIDGLASWQRQPSLQWQTN